MLHIEKAKKFLQEIKPKDNVIIIFNNDADGICSCVLIKKYLEKIKCQKPFIISQPMPPEDNLIKKIQTTLPDKIIFLDMAIDQEQQFMKNIKNLCNILIIDHHQITKDMNSKNIVHINPRIENPKIYQSTTYIVYKIISEIMDFSEFLWIASVGMIADYNLDDSKDIVKEIKKKYKIKDGNLHNTHFGKISDMIAAAKATKKLSMEQIVDLIMEIKDPYKLEEARNSYDLIKSYQEVENELIKIKSEFESKIEKKGEFIFYKFSSPYNLRSPVSTMLSERYKNKIVVVYEKVNSWIDVSARNQSKKYNVGKIFSLAVQGLRGSAGGHEAAAGAKIAEKDWEKFIERLEEIIS